MSGKGWAKSWEKDGEKKVIIGEKNVEKGIFQHEICMALNEWQHRKMNTHAKT